MQPQQPQQPHVNYDFIINPTQPPKRSPLGGYSMATRLLVVFGGLFLLMLVVGLGMRLLSGGGVDKAAYVNVAQQQSELARLSTNGVENAVSQSTKNFAITTKITMASEQKVFLTYLNEGGVKPKEEELALMASAKTDTQLADAKSASNFDPVFTNLMKQRLDAYMADLSTLYNDASPTGKKMLSARYDAAALLLRQLTGEVKE